MFKLLAIDLDGTLVRSDHSISPRTRDTLVAVQEEGVRVVIASGRPTQGTASAADALELGIHGGFVMSYNGGEVYDWTTKERIYARTLDDGVTDFLQQRMKGQDVALMTYMDGCVITEQSDNEYVRYSSLRNGMPIKQTNDFVAETRGRELSKCIVTGSPKFLPQLEETLRKELEGQANVFRSEPFFLEIVPDGVNKACGLEIVLAHTGLNRKDLIAFGDGYNDVPMLQFAGMGVAMGNAAKEIKDLADTVTLSNDEDGIAYFLTQLSYNTTI